MTKQELETKKAKLIAAMELGSSQYDFLQQVLELERIITLNEERRTNQND